MSYVPTTPQISADAAAHHLATQAENYRRAIAAGVPHDLSEARSLLATAKTLLWVLEEKMPAAAPQTAPQPQTGDTP